MSAVCRSYRVGLTWSRNSSSNGVLGLSHQRAKQRSSTQRWAATVENFIFFFIFLLVVVDDGVEGILCVILADRAK